MKKETSMYPGAILGLALVAMSMRAPLQTLWDWLSPVCYFAPWADFCPEYGPQPRDPQINECDFVGPCAD